MEIYPAPIGDTDVRLPEALEILKGFDPHVSTRCITISDKDVTPQLMALIAEHKLPYKLTDKKARPQPDASVASPPAVDVTENVTLEAAVVTPKWWRKFLPSEVGLDDLKMLHPKRWNVREIFGFCIFAIGFVLLIDVAPDAVYSLVKGIHSSGLPLAIFSEEYRESYERYMYSRVGLYITLGLFFVSTGLVVLRGK